MLKIYGVHRSRATRVYWLAGELGLTYEKIPVLQAYKLADPMAADAPLNTRTPAFLAINPMGAIPSIDDDGLKLHESLAITLYLAKKHGGPLAPQNLAEDAQMVQWSLFAATEIESNALKISQLNAEGRLSTEAGAQEAQAHARLLKRPFGVLEKHFSDHAYAVAERFTVGDINLAEVVRYAQPLTSLMDAHPHVRDWLVRCQARPAFKAMWQARLDEKE
ncbi:glutathione S-transferase family protein [Agrobacterium sp. a22-2]|uniref:glutathione S-transferase family protein n=1 Tax=Agrobacterium sp. a22-2 TaxID=2283840 RepID=UPI0014459089|nr:glutathione S-transferase family protein [Agrobacterium sp. a22-2]NKN39571.1 glutathione S-transferase family protein [Agrobacterium sp. a22-2]